MANYAVDDYTEDAADLAAILAKLETKIETIDNTKTIRLIEVYQVGASLWSYALVVDA
tara:strand:+ start:297 stop:470 length:174 start_codon:yes stop_codon:yes gene_type:complete